MVNGRVHHHVIEDGKRGGVRQSKPNTAAIRNRDLTLVPYRPLPNIVQFKELTWFYPSRLGCSFSMCFA